jgi:hypothetical protein
MLYFKIWNKNVIYNHHLYISLIHFTEQSVVIGGVLSSKDELTESMF